MTRIDGKPMKRRQASVRSRRDPPAASGNSAAATAFAATISRAMVVISTGTSASRSISRSTLAGMWVSITPGPGSG